MLGIASLVIEEMTIGLGFAIIRSRSLGSELTLQMYTTSSLVHTSWSLTFINVRSLTDDGSLACLEVHDVRSIDD